VINKNPFPPYKLIYPHSIDDAIDGDLQWENSDQEIKHHPSPELGKISEEDDQANNYTAGYNYSEQKKSH
jgi:hypothetical protein